MLLSLLNNKTGKGFVLTSNVDGHFIRAGFDESIVEEIHGSINFLQCTRTECIEKKSYWATPVLDMVLDKEGMVKAEEIPRCKECNAVARPNILMFRDSTCVKLRLNEQRDRFDEWVEKVKSKKLKAVVLEIGAGTSVGTVRANSEKFAKETNSSIIRVN